MKYPFSPDVLDAMPEALAELFRELELALLREIGSRLMIADNLNQVTVQDIRALRAHGISVEEITKEILKTTGIGEKKLNELLEDVVRRNQRYYTHLVDIAHVTAPEALVDEAAIRAIIRQANEEYRNITASMGFLVDSGRTMLKPAKVYQWALDNALMQVQSGAISYGKAIANATQQLADSGLVVVNYESGHRDQVDVAVRRAVMTGVNQLNSRYADESMDYLETEYVEVSAHSGARDKDGPKGWENHKKWQGKVYWWKEHSRRDKPEYPLPEFAATCGYGDVTGILGANCRHNYMPFIPDVMERTYTDEQLANIDPPDFEYEGRKYTHYEATQQQRAIERAIRKWKRREAAATDPAEKKAIQARIRIMKQKYEEFSKAANLRTQPERMKAYVPKQKTVDNSAGRGIISNIRSNRVETGKHRNEGPLTKEQIKAATEAARKQGYDRDIEYSDYSFTSFIGYPDDSCLLVIGTDAYPSGSPTTANEAISLNGAMAHEVVGHYEAWMKGTRQSVDVLEEAQASIRASKFGIGLTGEERDTLYQDAMDRLASKGIKFEDVMGTLDIWER